MRVVIDNLDGRGAVDYSDALAPEGPVTIERVLNKPSTCHFLLIGTAGAPVREGRVVVTRDDWTVLFTGYLPEEPEAVFAGEASAGGVYRLRVTATSDEWLLDKQGVRVSGESFAVTGDALLAGLTSRVDGVRFATAAMGPIATVGALTVEAGRSWSESAAAIAGASGAAYRVLAGEVQVVPLGAVRHELSLADGTLRLDGLRLAPARASVNDVTVCGEVEAGAYVTQVFTGDGTTAEFQLSGAPFAGGAARGRVLVDDAFVYGTLDAQRWAMNAQGGHVGVGAGGLLLNGGTGVDGQTTLELISRLELGGSLLLEARGVALTGASAGVLLGLYNGATNRADCVAGFDVQQSGGATTLGCVVSGASAGTTVTLASGHLYTLRLRCHAAETQRVRQRYVVVVDGVAQMFGGGSVDAALDVVLEVQDAGSSANAPATVLYDGRILAATAVASFVPVNSLQMFGSIGALTARHMAAAWVRSQPAGGVARTRLMGGTGTGADCTLRSNGLLHFYPGRVPAAGEQIVVQYRRSQRAVARVRSTAGVATESRGGLPGVAAAMGRASSPVARSSEDCASAAAAVLAVGSSRAAALAGSYKAEALPNIWPGDLLVIDGENGEAQMIARRVQVVNVATAPELVRTTVEFANEWAQPLSVRLEHGVPVDAMLPDVATPAWTVAGLGGLSVVSVNSSAVQVDAGTDPPAGGGFEVRRFDGGFGPGTGGSLVMRSAVRGWTIPRAAQVERFFVRMYDGSTPPVYSRLSSEIATDVPVG